MSIKSVSDELVCKAVAQYHEDKKIRTSHIAGTFKWPYDYLRDWTGQPEKICWGAMERALKHGLIDYGVSLRTGWLTEKGKALIENKIADE